MKKELNIISELYRMREIMGIGNLSYSSKKYIQEQTSDISKYLLTEAVKPDAEFMAKLFKALGLDEFNAKFFGKSISDNWDTGAKQFIELLEKEGLDDITKLQEIIGKIKGVDPTTLGKDVVDNALALYFKKNPEIAENLLKSNADFMKDALAGKSFSEILSSVNGRLGIEIDDFIKNTNITPANAGVLRDNLRDLQREFENSGLDMNDEAIKDFAYMIADFRAAADALDGSSTKIDANFSQTGQAADNTTIPTETMRSGGRTEPEPVKTEPEPEPVKFPEPEDEISDEIAEEIVTNPNSKIDEIFDTIVKNRSLRKKIAPNLDSDDFIAIRGRLKEKYGNVPIGDLVSRYDQVKGDALIMLKKAQKIIDDADKGIVSEGTDPNKYRVAKNVVSYLTDNKLTRACIGEKRGSVDFKLKSVLSIPSCLLGLYFMIDFLSWVNTDKSERDWIGCNTAGYIVPCEFFTQYGYCEKSCSEKTEPIFQKVYDDKDEDFAKWVAENSGTLPDKDGSGRFYTDKDGTKQYVTHDPAKRTFTNKANTPSTCVWKTDADAITALKKTFESAVDADITVDLANCKVTYKNPILDRTDSYTPTDLQ
jgi:hypothetical protein